MSRRFKYVGPFDEVEVAGQVVARGEVAEFDTAAADGLDGQASWEHVPDKRRSTAAKKAAKRRPAKKAAATPPAEPVVPETPADNNTPEG